MEFAQSGSFAGNIIAWSPLSLAVFFLGIGIVLFGPRTWVLPAFLTVSALMSFALHVIILGQHFMPHRVLLLCAWTRFLLRGEHRGLKLSSLDKTFIWFCVCMVFTETLQTGLEGFIYAVANSGVDALGTYFLCRVIFREREDLRRAVVCMAALCAVVGGFMLVEYLTGRNWLTALGAVQDMIVSRKGRRRCAGAFNIAITAGTFGAVFLPLFVACWWQGGKLKKWAIPGCLASTIITVSSASAGPLSTYIVAILGFLAWPLRGQMRKVRWAIALGLFGLHLVMKAPVWALIMRIQIVPGASAYHRYNILDTFITNIDQWWLYGIQSTAKWGWEMEDVANQYCVFAKHGGLLALLLFILVLARGFREVGLTRKAVAGDRPTEIMVWAFGVLLFAHATAFFAISYFDQMKIFWYLTLGMIASLKLLVPAEATLPIAEAQEEPASQQGDSGPIPAAVL
jgi:hypothetical protein